MSAFQLFALSAACFAGSGLVLLVGQLISEARAKRARRVALVHATIARVN